MPGVRTLEYAQKIIILNKLPPLRRRRRIYHKQQTDRHAERSNPCDTSHPPLPVLQTQSTPLTRPAATFAKAAPSSGTEVEKRLVKSACMVSAAHAHARIEYI
jgi:hypothetical protein